jgi:hypothetical protein
MLLSSPPNLQTSCGVACEAKVPGASADTLDLTESLERRVQFQTSTGRRAEHIAELGHPG